MTPQLTQVSLKTSRRDLVRNARNWQHAAAELATELERSKEREAALQDERDRYRKSLEWIHKHWGMGEENLRDEAALALGLPEGS